MSALSPQERDALLAELRTRTNTPGFHFLSPEHLQDLNALASDDAPVLSLYLALTPEARTNDAWHAALKNLRDKALADPRARTHKQAVSRDLERIEEALRGGLPRTGRGVAFFACEGIGLFRQLGVPTEVADEVYLNRTPYVRPLARVRDEHDRFALALVSLHHSRFFFSQIGLVEEVFALLGEDVDVTDYTSKDQRRDIRDEHRRQMAQRSAHALDLIADTLGVRHVLYAVPPDMEATFLDALGQGTRQKANPFACDVRASAAEVAVAAEPVQREIEEREEMETIGRVRELLTSRAVAGLDATLEMLNQQRVMTLVVNDDLRVPGGIDSVSGMLTTSTNGTYPATGGRIEPEADLFEAMLERALAQGATLELVRSEAAKEALDAHGPAAALLRF